MLDDNSGVAKIYIITGYTDMRKNIDGLCATIMSRYSKSRAVIPSIFSAANVATVSKSYYANRMDMFFYIKAYQKENLCTFQRNKNDLAVSERRGSLYLSERFLSMRHMPPPMTYHLR